MQNLIDEKPSKKNYDFIDHIRCLAMMSIVFEHCFGDRKFPMFSDKFWVYLSWVELTKFGTVAFFLLAGFLISDKFTDYTPSQYLKRRFSTTFGPWLFWSVMFNIFMVITLHITEGMYHDGRFTLAHILENIKITYFYTNYWFIINFMVSITILLIFKRYLYSKVFGSVLLAFTLFYCVNIHYEWIDPSHTVAIMGFIFFLWLGAQLRKHWTPINQWIEGIPYTALFIALIIVLGLSMYETIALMHHGSRDPYNTLRFSAVVYALLFFMLLLKYKKFSGLNYLKPRQTTYGIYLIHYIIFTYLLNEILMHLPIDENSLSAAGFALYRIFAFVIVYTITWIVVTLINKTPLKVLVGN
ncbi:peptidoglycan/LPS O-acetylase OafA/YrhL [Mucilaginibacter yixingensis]|uniref:Peptidoglycan/LPS O-acetylase OafA/YrhL n=1 Tax=Mucilaginibacter yixingensis TaxID=1295612 RepID=A0A2T5JBY7_9SPHI|nr:acyltransferase [Mucilaginibacter yixingensis]PTQ99281.1 peptidoglycan/LPS O-acetylase OafA/YrhL [Mucilaginibacter yixingensis]